MTWRLVATHLTGITGPWPGEPPSSTVEDGFGVAEAVAEGVAVADGVVGAEVVGVADGVAEAEVEGDGVESAKAVTVGTATAAARTAEPTAPRSS
jgi:hypothetical protein